MVIIGLWKVIIEISILWFVIYQVMLFFIGTRAIQVVRGIIVLLIVFFLVQRLDLERLEWLLTKLFALSVLGLLIIFQTEIRRGLASLGRHHLFTLPLREEELEHILKEITKAVDYLAHQNIGALIAFEREVPLKAYIDTGVVIDGVITAELVQNIFTPGSLLHDGGVIIQQGRVVAAGCLFPLNEDLDISRIFGMRHRAAIGLTQESDAVVIVVSEERRDISLAYEGKLFQGVNRDDLLPRVKQLIKPKKDK
ncbi:MAG: diadenylate cyclase CdaA [Candidatus Omnitrophota bacterium]